MMDHPEMRDGYALFWGQWPSNWQMSAMELDGVQYNCVEQYMMAEKARLFGDEETRDRILMAAEPREQKALGRKVRGFDEAAWEKARYQIVLRGTLEKYRQNPELRSLLLATGNAVFVECAPDDTVWGIGMRRQDPGSTDPRKWRGLNLLGRAITEARTIIRDSV
jgi:ribA/ribD-fused uncharacterized protein